MYKTVLQKGALVVKIRTGPKNRSHCGGAVKFYEGLDPDMKKHFVPVLAEGDDYQIQRYVTPCGDPDCDEGTDIHWDGHWCNHTHINGVVMVFDY